MEKKNTESVEKKMIIFMNAGVLYDGFIMKHHDGTMCAGVFEMGIIISNRAGDKQPVIELSHVEKEKEKEKEAIIIEPIATFFKQTFNPGGGRRNTTIASVASFLIGSDLFMFPESGQEGTLLPPPLKFNLLLNTTTSNSKGAPDIPPNFPLSTTNPVIAVVRHRVYLLSFFVSRNTSPSFFHFVDDVGGGKWIKLNFPNLPPIPLKNGRPPLTVINYSGHAVLDDEGGFVLVSFRRSGVDPHDELFFYSYNVQTGNWKPVGSLNRDKEYPSSFVLYGECVVIGNDIYTYIRTATLLFVASYTISSSKKYDILMGNYKKVEGLKIHDEHTKRFLHPFPRHIKSIPSGVVVKLDDQILCVLNTMYVDADQILHVCVSVIQFEERRDCCTTLKTFKCLFKAGTQLSYPTINSSYVMNLNGTIDHRPRKRAALEDDKQMDLA